MHHTWEKGLCLSWTDLFIEHGYFNSKDIGKKVMNL